jgi:hypothetical protein
LASSSEASKADGSPAKRTVSSKRTERGIW